MKELKARTRLTWLGEGDRLIVKKGMGGLDYSSN